MPARRRHRRRERHVLTEHRRVVVRLDHRRAVRRRHHLATASEPRASATSTSCRWCKPPATECGLPATVNAEVDIVATPSTSGHRRDRGVPSTVNTTDPVGVPARRRHRRRERHVLTEHRRVVVRLDHRRAVRRRHRLVRPANRELGDQSRRVAGVIHGDRVRAPSHRQRRGRHRRHTMTSGVTETCGVPSTVNNTDPVGVADPRRHRRRERHVLTEHRRVVVRLDHRRAVRRRHRLATASEPQLGDQSRRVAGVRRA